MNPVCYSRITVINVTDREMRAATGQWFARFDSIQRPVFKVCGGPENDPVV